jgi:hypothetical protein
MMAALEISLAMSAGFAIPASIEDAFIQASTIAR